MQQLLAVADGENGTIDRSCHFDGTVR